MGNETQDKFKIKLVDFSFSSSQYVKRLTKTYLLIVVMPLS